MTVAAIVAARGGSIRLPRKALLPFGGTSLIAHKVRTLLRTAAVSTVYANTDDAEIRAAAVAAGAKPLAGADYADDTRRMLADSVRQIPESVDAVVWAHPTNPLIRATTYDAALTAYANGLAAGFDSLLSVYEVRRHAWAGGRPLNYDPWGDRHPLAAELEPVAFQDGAIFVQSRARWLETRYFFGARPYLFTVPPTEACDIDTPADFAVACALYPKT